jgi:GT2 family glycosyltransferase
VISIVIPNYNGKHFLEGCLSSIASQTFRDFETILVDNASRDWSIPFIIELFPLVEIIENPVNLGFAGGTNAGIRQSKGQFILTLNNDTRLSADFLEQVMIAIKSNQNAGIVAPKMLLMDGRINHLDVHFLSVLPGTGECLMMTGPYNIPETVIGHAGAAYTAGPSLMTSGFLMKTSSCITKMSTFPFALFLQGGTAFTGRLP